MLGNAKSELSRMCCEPETALKRDLPSFSVVVSGFQSFLTVVEWSVCYRDADPCQL